MKKLILFAAILFAGVSVVNAQNKTTHTPVRTGHLKKSEVINEGHSSDKTNLMVTLNAIQSISVNTEEIHLEYKTVSDYQEGVQTDFITGHLSVYSTGGYDIGVKYDNPITDNSVGNSKTAADLFESIQVGVESKGYKALKRSSENIISSDNGGMNVRYNVNYRGLGTDKYIDYVQNNKTRVLSADVIYEITAK